MDEEPRWKVDGLKEVGDDVKRERNFPTEIGWLFTLARLFNVMTPTDATSVTDIRAADNLKRLIVCICIRSLLS